MRLVLHLSLLLLAPAVSAQYISVNDTYAAQQLVASLIDASCAQVANISLSGSPDNKSYGYFTNASPGFPMNNGIILSTGYTSSAQGPNSSLLSEGAATWLGDPDLEDALLVNNTINATVLEFDFIPYTDKISFDYIFSSEQYLTSITSQNQCNYTDGFAFLIKEAGSTSPYKNLAVVPGTDIPVKVNTVRGEGVCPSANEQYFGGFNPVEHPTNFNGQTVVLQAQTAVTAGTLYHIKLVVADQGNNLYDSAILLGGGSFKNITDLGPDRLFDTLNPLCTGETLTLDATTANAMGYKWYKKGALLAETSPLYNVTSGGEYSVTVEFGISCTSIGKIRIEESTPPPASSYNLVQCDEDNNGLAVYNLDLAYKMITNNDTSLYVNYYLSEADAQNSSNPIANTSAFQNTVPNQMLYAQVMTPYSCFSISKVNLLTSNNTLVQPPPIGLCDEDGSVDGFRIFDLTTRNAEILQNLPQGLQLDYYTTENDALLSVNQISNPSSFINTSANTQIIYSRVYNGADCFGIVPLELMVYSFGNSLQDEEVIQCAGETIILNAGADYASYEWNGNPLYDQNTFVIDQPGDYTVKVSNSQGCFGSKTFTVIPSGPATDVVIDINDFNGGNNSVTIEPIGSGNYEFSLDSIHFQDSNVFNNLDAGEYKVYINDQNGCGMYSDRFYVLDYPLFFTPNNDGKHDVWRIPYLSFVPDAEVIVFDRYGQLITGFKGSGSWDGNLNGRPLPATDYWFVIKLRNKTVKGHFSLLR
ncbi:choice-of-anchor L domain-containing protein [Flavobacterium sp. DG1-102-2]|uniref:choice-of-anchor L domain-containing protein n=1 Tax=Flavobacterium sp. DG1-102-2 TaxID=3081663 RepID=UPI00294A7E52|nr:choice-of-anchor L domain-containing protein [Flavobacterium sp. DG1-102-2]MDV6170375.1 choice-of-anchor L domain-containing protein [Flavobacterium sp. DG1-102-2]